MLKLLEVFSAVCILSAWTSGVAAQFDSVHTLVNTLQQAGLTSLVQAIVAINETEVGRSLNSSLFEGNWTIFAPTNDAFDGVPSNVSSNTELLSEIISYHFVRGRFENTTSSNVSLASSACPSVTIGRTFLNSSDFVQLEGNKSQVVGWCTNEDGEITILNQADNVTIANTTSVGNDTNNMFLVNVIDEVLIPPGNLTATAANRSLDIDMLAGILANVTTAAADGTNVSLAEALSSARGITIFAPTNDALQAAASTLASLQNNQLAVVLGNHVINGTTVYSTGLTAANYTSASGEPFSFTLNSTGAFVTSANSTARITRSDVFTSNGVIHLIDTVLANLESDPSAAASAFSSATANAAASTTETGPVGPATTSSTSSGNNNNGAQSLPSGRATVPLTICLGLVLAAMGASLL